MATTLSGLTCFLNQNPETLEQLTQEVRRVFQNYEDITATKAQQLPYLKACLHEALRLFPPASGGAPRVSPGFELHGMHIPEGVSRRQASVATEEFESRVNEVSLVSHRPTSTSAHGQSRTTPGTLQIRGRSSQSAGWTPTRQITRTPVAHSCWGQETAWEESQCPVPSVHRYLNY